MYIYYLPQSYDGRADFFFRKEPSKYRSHFKAIALPAVVLIGDETEWGEVILDGHIVWRTAVPL